MWGTAGSSTQCEGAAPTSDWWDWERQGNAPASGDGNGFATRYSEDFLLLARLGLTHHRMSIDWARLEPEEGRRDPVAVEHYRRLLATARGAGIAPWVCLHHFTLPRWFAELGGFTVERNRTEHWRRHVEFVAETFDDLVFGWLPINETNYYARAAYGGGGWPPGHNDAAEVAVVEEAMHLASAEACVLLKSTRALVVTMLGLAPIVPQDEDPETSAAAQAIYDVLWAPGIGLYRDGILRVPGRDPVSRVDLAGAADMFGFSYYSAIGVRNGRHVRHPPTAPISPLGYGIWAAGISLVLEGLSEALPGTPLLVSEYGIGTDDDDARSAYLEEGVSAVNDAVNKGCDVRGFFHWCAVDNYEWLHGYDVKFGIIDADRRIKPSAMVLEREARAHEPHR